MKKIMRMKNLFLAFLFAVLALFGASPQEIFASETDVTYTTLTVTASVPSEYVGDIAFVFTQQDSGFNYQLMLTKEKKYTGTLTIIGDMEYTATVTVKKNADSYKVTGLSDGYKVTGTEVSLNFAIEKGLLDINNSKASGNHQSQQSVVSTDNSSNDNDTITESTNLPTAESSYKTYIDAVSFMYGNSDFDGFLKNYDNDIMKGYFLNADSLNTENDWQSMNSFEKFNYYILFVRTKTLIIGENAVKSEADLLKELSSENALLGNIKGGDKVIDAVRKIWSWEWMNWEQTGEFVNLYDPYTEGSANKHTETELTNEDEVEIAEAQDEINHEKSTVDRVKSSVMKNVLSISILACTGIALLVIIIIRRKKNYNNIED